MRQAASAWERDYTTKLEALGFKKGLAALTVFYCKSKGVRCVVHGDDFTFTGKRRDLFVIKQMLEESYELKMRAMLGGGAKRKMIMRSPSADLDQWRYNMRSRSKTCSGNIVLFKI